MIVSAQKPNFCHPKVWQILKSRVLSIFSGCLVPQHFVSRVCRGNRAMEIEELGGEEMSSTGRGKFYGICSMVVVSKSTLKRPPGNLHYIQLPILSHKKTSSGLSIFPVHLFTC